MIGGSNFWVAEFLISTPKMDMQGYDFTTKIGLGGWMDTDNIIENLLRNLFAVLFVDHTSVRRPTGLSGNVSA